MLFVTDDVTEVGSAIGLEHFGSEGFEVVVDDSASRLATGVFAGRCEALVEVVDGVPEAEEALVLVLESVEH